MTPIARAFRQQHIRSRRSRTPRIVPSRRPHVEQLETRQLLSASVGSSPTADYELAAAIAAAASTPVPGTLDASFGVNRNGKVSTFVGGGTSYANAVAIQPDGKIVAVGSGSNGGSFGVARYLPRDGSLDVNGFNPGRRYSSSDPGTVVTNFGGDSQARDVVIQSHEAQTKIVVVGSVSGGLSFGLARYLENGNLDHGFSEDGRVTTYYGGGASANAVAIQPLDNKIVVVGKMGNDFGIARYLPDTGELDRGFGNGGVVRVDFGGTDEARDVAIDGNRRIVVVGSANNGLNFGIARLTETGALDRSFDYDGKATVGFGGTSYAEAVVIQTDNKILVVGNGSNAFGLVRFNEQGSLDTQGFNPRGEYGFWQKGMVREFVGGYSTARDVVVQPDGKIVVVGDSSGMFGTARFHPDGRLDTQFDKYGATPGEVRDNISGPANYASGVALQADGKIVVVGDGGNRFGILRYHGSLPQPEMPVLSFRNPSAEIVEGDAGTKGLRFTVTLSNPSLETVSVQYMTRPGTAGEGSDFLRTRGSLTFRPGESEKPIVVPIVGDTTVEIPEQEKFYVDLSEITQAQAGVITAEGIIVDNDSPSISIDNALPPTINEGNPGRIQYARFPVRLSRASLDDVVRVHYATRDGTATAQDGDYGAVLDGILEFRPGETVSFVKVQINGDAKWERNEDLYVDLSNPENATLNSARRTGKVTIVNDDALPVNRPALSISSAEVTEGDQGFTYLDFRVSLSRGVDEVIAVAYRTRDGSAKAGEGDYEAALDGILEFQPGETEKTIRVKVLGDTLPEPDETLTLQVGYPDAPRTNWVAGQGRILNDDLPGNDRPVLSLVGKKVQERERVAVVEILVTGPRTQPITVHFNTRDGSATEADRDYIPRSGSVQILPTQAKGLVTILLNDDPKFEADELFYLEVTGAENARWDGLQTAPVVIVNDDVQPPDQPRIESRAIVEGNIGTRSLTFPVTLPGPASRKLTFSYSTRDGTAKTGDPALGSSGDYRPTFNQTLVFEPGESAKAITVEVIGDTENERGEEFFYLDLHQTSPFPGALSQEVYSAYGTIIDDDDRPNLPPVANEDRLGPVMVGHSVNVFPLANDRDPDPGDTLSIVRFQERTAYGGRVTWGVDSLGNRDLRQLVYTAPVAWSGGLDGFSYWIADGQGHEVFGVVTVRVNPNQLPTARPDRVTTVAGTPVAIRVLDNDSDPEGQPLSIVGFNQRSVRGGTITRSLDDPRVLIYTPPAPVRGKPFQGTDSFHYSISDGWNAKTTAQGRVMITVTGPATVPPVLLADLTILPIAPAASDRASQPRDVVFGNERLDWLLDSLV